MRRPEMSDIVKSLDLAVRRFISRSSPCILEGGSGTVDRFPRARSSVLPSPKARPPKFRGFFFGVSSQIASAQQLRLGRDLEVRILGQRANPQRGDETARARKVRCPMPQTVWPRVGDCDPTNLLLSDGMAPPSSPNLRHGVRGNFALCSGIHHRAMYIKP